MGFQNLAKICEVLIWFSFSPLELAATAEATIEDVKFVPGRGLEVWRDSGVGSFLN